MISTGAGGDGMKMSEINNLIESDDSTTACMVINCISSVISDDEGGSAITMDHKTEVNTGLNSGDVLRSPKSLLFVL